MAQVKLSGVAIRGVVVNLPGEPLPVEACGARLDAEDVRRAKEKVGLRQLHRVTTETACDLCVGAAQQLLTDLDWPPASVDAVIFVTQNPDHFLPANACLVHKRLGLSDQAAAFDVGMGCSGYVYGLLLAAQFIATGTARRVLLLAGDTASRGCSPYDKSTALLFGDAGSATAVEAHAAASPWSIVAGTDGSGADSLIIPAGGYRSPANAQTVERRTQPNGTFRADTEFEMDGLAVFAFSLQRVPPLVSKVLALQGWSPDPSPQYLFHQANEMMLQALIKKMKLEPIQVPINIGRYGNTSSASIPLLLADDLAAKLQQGAERLVLVGFGVGFSWAALAGQIGPLGSARVMQSPRSLGAS